jgi:hypothetical protein
MQGCPAFSHLTLTGGAIGSGPPLAVGAAVACPARQVINLQADGSAMYSLQVGCCCCWYGVYAAPGLLLLHPSLAPQLLLRRVKA